MMQLNQKLEEDMKRLREESKKQYDQFNSRLNQMKIHAIQVKQETTNLNEYVYGIGFRQALHAKSTGPQTKVESPFTQLFEQNRIKQRH